MNATFGFMYGPGLKPGLRRLQPGLPRWSWPDLIRPSCHDNAAYLGGVQHRRAPCVKVGVALISIGHLQQSRLGERPRRDLQANWTAVWIEAAVHADRRQAKIIVGSRSGRN